MLFKKKKKKKLTSDKFLGFPGGSVSKESTCNVGDLGSIPGLGRPPPGGGHSNPLQYSCFKNPHGQRSLVGCSPWGHKESDTTEKLSTAQAQQHSITNYRFCSNFTKFYASVHYLFLYLI